jgi:hypothetical protein
MLFGLLIASGASATTPEEAAKLFAAQQWEAAAAAYQVIVDKDPVNVPAWFWLARALAAKGDSAGALAALKSWIGAGGGNYQAAMTVPELQSLRADPRFTAMVEPLKPCTAPEYRQFDFWLGEWNVEAPASPGVVSRSRITSINDGCTVLEQYTSPSGYEGSSVNFYDAARKVWHQTWIDNQGAPLYLEGGLDGKSMVLGTTSNPMQVNRIIWTPLDDGRVRQHWESTTDGGKNWSTVFDGYYSRVATAASPAGADAAPAD